MKLLSHNQRPFRTFTQVTRSAVRTVFLVGFMLAFQAVHLTVVPIESGARTTKRNTTGSKTTRSKTTHSKNLRSQTTRATTSKDWQTLNIAAETLPEVSGCTVSSRDPRTVWLHNDADDGAIVVPVNLDSGAVGPAVTLEGVNVKDPEDVASLPNGDLMLADIGDNLSRRSSVALVRFPEPATGTTSVAGARRMVLRYPDGAHNAEAFVVTKDGASGLIITKDKSGTAQVFRADLGSGAAEQELVPLGRITIDRELLVQPNLITAADIHGDILYMRTYQFGYSVSLPAGKPLAAAFGPTPASPKHFVLPLMIQGEALCVSPDGKTMITASESRGDSTFAMSIGPVPR